MSKKHKKAKATKATLIPPATEHWSYTPKSPKKVMEIDGVNIYGGSAFLISRVPNMSLRIDLSGSDLPDTKLVNGNTAAYEWLPPSLFTQKVPVLYINWRDGTAHTLDLAWWETLITAIKDLPEGSSVGVCCVGGTGRTGTVLAVLAGLTNQTDYADSDPVKWLRAHYYDDAVETDEQLWYVEDITGRLVSVSPSFDLYRPVTHQHETQVLGIPTESHSQATVTGPLGGPSSVGASDHTGS